MNSSLPYQLLADVVLSLQVAIVAFVVVGSCQELEIMKIKYIARSFLWFFVAAITIWAVIYFLQHFDSISFQEGTMGNLFATILGLVVGVPIALEINRRQQEAEHAIILARSEQEGKQRKTKVLSLIRSELKSNKRDLIFRAKDVAAGGKRQVHVNTLRDEMWSAFSDGGELHYVNSPELLALIAGAYYEIRTTIHLERRFMDAIHFSGMRVKQEKYPQDFFLEYLTSTDPNVLEAIDRAVAKIDSEIPPKSDIQ